MRVPARTEQWQIQFQGTVVPVAGQVSGEAAISLPQALLPVGRDLLSNARHNKTANG